MDIYKIALLGDKDHGKSTTIGSLLMLTGSISETRIEEAKKTSRKLGRPFEPGFLLDSFSEEREDAMTIDTTRAQIQHKGSGFEFIDVPGHEELISNMLTGASNASTAILMVSAKPGEGISEQTKRHIMLARMLGISKIVIAVNKMDTVGYSKRSFDSIRSSMMQFMREAEKSFGPFRVKFVPVSSYKAENLVSLSDNMGWYKGSPLIEEVKNFAKSKEDEPKYLRAIVQGSIDGLAACKIIYGSMSAKSTVGIVPRYKRCKISMIVKAGKPARKAERGSAPAIKLECHDVPQRGSIIFSGKRPMVGNKISAVAFFIFAPKKCIIKMNGSQKECSFKPISEINIVTAKASKAESVKPLGIYRVSIKAKGEMAYEKFKYAADLGRFTIYDGNKLAGFGIIM